MNGNLEPGIIGTTFGVYTEEVLSYSTVIKEGDVKKFCKEYCEKIGEAPIKKIDIATTYNEHCFLIQCKYGKNKIPTDSVDLFIRDCNILINCLKELGYNYKYTLIYLTRTAPVRDGITALLNSKNKNSNIFNGFHISLYDRDNELNGYTIADNMKDFKHLWAILYYKIYEITGVYPTFKELGSNDAMMIDGSLFK
jgi:hypothetical protein